MRGSETREPSSLPWRESMRGGWLNTLAPTAALLLTILGDTFKAPGWLSAAAVAVVWFGGFLVLIRAQFALRRRSTDVFRAFWRSTALGFTLVAVVLVAMYLVGRM